VLIIGLMSITKAAIKRGGRAMNPATGSDQEAAPTPAAVVSIVSALPPEALDAIAQFLPAQDLATLRLVSTQMAGAVDHSWQQAVQEQDQTWQAYLMSIQDQMARLPINSMAVDAETLEALVAAAETYLSYAGTDWTQWSQAVQALNNQIATAMPGFVAGVDLALETQVENGQVQDTTGLNARLLALLAAFPHQ
jgi:F-box domain